MINWE